MNNNTDNTTRTNAEAKNRSYTMRKRITGEGQDFNHRRHGKTRTIQVTSGRLAGTTAELLSTTNAGFNGITCHLRLPDGTTRTTSLGHCDQQTTDHPQT